MQSNLLCRIWFGAVACALAATPATLARTDLFGWQTTDNNFNAWSLVRWQNPPSGGTVRIGANQGLSFDPAFSPAGQLYGTDGSSVFTISTTTGNVGAPVPITSHIFGLGEFLSGLTFSPTGTMYAWTLNNTTSGIYTINPQNGTAATIISNTAATLFGMTFAPNGNLYASDGSSLTRLNPLNGTVLQTIGSFPEFITSLGWGPDGILRGLSPALGGNGTSLYSINPANASTTFLGSSTENIYGIAAIPAPGSIAALSVLGLAAARRRRR